MAKSSDIDELINKMQPKRKPEDIDVRKLQSHKVNSSDNPNISTSKKTAFDYYKILGVEPTATQIEIKRAYQKKLKKLHPDRTEQTKENIAKYKLLREAGDILSDQYERKAYDMQKKSDNTYKNHDEKRESFKDFLKLQEQSMTEDDRKIAKLNFERGLAELDNKHGYKKEQHTPITIDDYNTLIKDSVLIRNDEDNELKPEEIFKGKKFNPNKFNKLFEEKKQRDEKRKKNSDGIVKYSGDILAFNDGDDGLGGASVNDYDALYAEGDYNGYSDKYAGIGNGLIGNGNDISDDEISIDTPTEDNYDTHNKGNSQDKFNKSFQKMMAERETDYEKLMSLDPANEMGSALDDKYGISKQFGFMIGTDKFGHQKTVTSKIDVKKETLKAYKELTE
jgi:curved DNA-binding protein CbpA